MNNTYKLVELAKAKTGIDSDYGIAKLIGVTRAMVSNWKTEKAEANVTNTLKLIKEAGLSVDDALKIMSKEAQTVNATESTANDNCILCKIVKFKIKAQLLRFAFKCRMQAICVHLLQTN